ncbi:CmpA/NrtA family ABC transporter substrate-binding protein [Leptolyngbya sp. NIES-2104]|uniref:CmpA/NrtA family ABC transporter substrate-binding protein n=1 Tax=Leptolyngbya sp. NIES-2104 TaxID=1552121 RepID=UPI0006EC6582|nr:CmpA/NrtA family ABC transporter substrate-binding protein [Leptolyngbya sp. NIES-2104]GAP95633.1 nitrate ABC transporter, nitrate-binding protein [Leptolyngbya sp. NIES-2104]
MSNLSRRKFLFTAGATAAGAVVVNGCSTGLNKSASSGSSPAAAPAVNVSAADAPETTTAKLGFIALTDSAPLIIALEKGYFAKYGMKDVSVTKQTSWAVVRDNLELGSDRGGIDGSHILTPMPYFISAGKITKGNTPVPMYILARLNTDGQGISISNDYADLKLAVDSTPLKAKIEELKSGGKKFKAAVTFPGGNHDLFMRYWLSAGGINPETDVDIVVVPPPQMVANMETKTMDAFCVGEPWNDRLVTKKIGYTAITTGEFWRNHPEKSFAMRADWVDKNPKAAKALLAAVQEAQVWCDKDENKEEMCKIISADKYIKAPVDDILERARGTFDMGNGRVLTNSDLLMKFWRESASFPFKSHDTWFVTENMRWGKFDANTDVKALVDKVNRSDLWQDAAKLIGQEAAIPKDTASRGVETFFDKVTFDAANPKAYLDSLKIKKA